MLRLFSFILLFSAFGLQAAWFGDTVTKKFEAALTDKYPQKQPEQMDEGKRAEIINQGPLLNKSFEKLSSMPLKPGEEEKKAEGQEEGSTFLNKLRNKPQIAATAEDEGPGFFQRLLTPFSKKELKSAIADTPPVTTGDLPPLPPPPPAPVQEQAAAPATTPTYAYVGNTEDGASYVVQESTTGSNYLSQDGQTPSQDQQGNLIPYAGNVVPPAQQ